jgi:UDP-N-acetylmuramate dehydrogenase
MISPLSNYPLKDLNSFGFNVCAERFLSTQSIEELKAALAWAKNNKTTVFALGGGSNLVLSKNISGLTIKQANTHINIVEQNNNTATVYASAGTSWHELVLYCVNKQLYGIENLSLIPGTVGAAPIQNIGAYGVELTDVLTRVDALDIATGESVTLNNKECEFSYRDSVFKQRLKNKLFITGLYLKLQKKPSFNLSYTGLQQALEDVPADQLSLKLLSQCICSIRQAKLPDPSIIGNAGSFFKNPSITSTQLEHIKNHYGDIAHHQLENNLFKIPAAWLVEKAGWKGFIRNGVGVHKQQAIVLVNYGCGKGCDILALAKDIQKDVAEKFDVLLSIEPVII